MAQRLNLEKSKDLFESAKKVIPGGLMGVRNPNFYIPNEYPMFLEKGYEGHLVDVDGNDYIDMLCAYGPIILGYNESEINQAVIEQMEKGFCFTLCQEVQKKLHEKLAELIPSAEMSILTKSGSDATSVAIRIARGYTGKKKILRCGYHGWHDWCVEPGGGVPQEIKALTIEFPYGNLDALEEILKENDGEVAGIIITPILHSRSQRVTEPVPGYLQGVRELADKYKAILIFDEIRTGFRMSLGGAQQYYGVTPDLSAFGKALANGYPISACVGKAEIMEIAKKDVYISSTFFPNSLEMVAALKCIDILERDNVLDKVWEKGKLFEIKLDKILKSSGVPVSLAGIAPMPYILFDKVDNYHQERTELFFTQTIRRKILLAPYHHWYIAHRHTNEDLDYILNAFEEALDITNNKYPVK
ncbi:MAG: aminotransferase class III-fold pyridoxal phosphate-dependent enzyme [Clostridia bacterium]|nr:aminotransferase class III-fold pyridoxal phosphate-dependent enzyme [Clostridia bacterium]